MRLQDKYCNVTRCPRRLSMRQLAIKCHAKNRTGHCDTAWDRSLALHFVPFSAARHCKPLPAVAALADSRSLYCGSCAHFTTSAADTLARCSMACPYGFSRRAVRAVRRWRSPLWVPREPARRVTAVCLLGRQLCARATMCNVADYRGWQHIDSHRVQHLRCVFDSRR